MQTQILHLSQPIKMPVKVLEKLSNYFYFIYYYLNEMLKLNKEYVKNLTKIY